MIFLGLQIHVSHLQVFNIFKFTLIIVGNYCNMSSLISPTLHNLFFLSSFIFFFFLTKNNL